jgi:hypothetical protein
VAVAGGKKKRSKRRKRKIKIKEGNRIDYYEAVTISDPTEPSHPDC